MFKAVTCVVYSVKIKEGEWGRKKRDNGKRETMERYRKTTFAWIKKLKLYSCALMHQHRMLCFVVYDLKLTRFIFCNFDIFRSENKTDQKPVIYLLWSEPPTK